jgi:hypothetical protein
VKTPAGTVEFGLFLDASGCGALSLPLKEGY